MRRSTIPALLLAGLLASPGAWAINKCTGPDGKVAFQDAPCADGRTERLNVRPASGQAPGAVAAPPAAAGAPGAAGPTAAAAPPQTEAQRIEGELAKSQTARRKRDLEVAGIPNARRAIDIHLGNCRAEQSALQAKKAHANNNLAGAQWETSISEEMNAAARNCATRTQLLTSELEALRRECSAVNCVPQ